MILNFCYISIFKSEEDNYDLRLRRLISNYSKLLLILCNKHRISFVDDNICAEAFYRYFSDRRISFAIFKKRNLCYIRIFDKWGRNCINRCCSHSNCQGMVPSTQEQKALGTKYVTDTAAFPYYFFYYYKCRFVQNIENDVAQNSVQYSPLQNARREIFSASMQFVTDVNDALKPHLVKEKCICKLERLQQKGIYNGSHDEIASRVSIDLVELRLQVEANEADFHDETDVIIQF